MSTKPTLVPQPEPPKEIPELTDAYRKAHKNYVLASGLLASWELIGITLQTKEKWGIELKSPTAVPLILFVLVIYSGYKMTIEWMQCNPDRKKHPAAKWDYRVAHGIAAIAVSISFIQYLLQIQILEVLTRHRNTTESVVLTLAAIFTFSIVFPKKSSFFSSLPARIAFPPLIFGLFVTADKIIGRPIRGTIIATSIGFAAGFLRTRLPEWRKGRAKQQTGSPQT